MKKLTIIAIGILMLAVLIFLGVRMTGRIIENPEQGKYDEFAKCLTTNGVKMYGAFWCSHCQAQKKMFGNSWQYVNYIECSNPDGTQTQECKLAGITAYPTWELGDGTRVSGELTFAELSAKSGCSLEEQ